MKWRKMYSVLLFCLFLATGIVTLLFVLSEGIMHRQNTFVRRFPKMLAIPSYQTDIKYNSYYFAGAGNGRIYLGNSTTPLQIMVLDTLLKTREYHTITLNDTTLPFRSVQVKVTPPYFYVLDGTVPCIYKGKTKNWKAFLRYKGTTNFSQAEIMDSTSIVFRGQSTVGENIIGKFNLTDTNSIVYGTDLLQKQIDGVFDTDGVLNYDSKMKQIVYQYRYRNQFIVADSDLKLKYRGKTIDTISKAQLKIAYIKNRRERTFAAPPLVVNKTSNTSSGLLFVNSALLGKYESLEIWKHASIIDVYNTSNNTYLSSFYVYDSNGKKMKSFVVYGNRLFALIGTELVSYELNKDLLYGFKPIKK